MRPYWILPAIFFLAPAFAYAIDTWQPTQPQAQPQMQPQASPQDVEEPDAPDEDTMGVPQTEPTPEIPQGPSTVAPHPAPPAAAQPQNPPNPAETGDVNYDKVVLQGLNKVTARAVTLEAPIGSVVRFGTIEIVAHKCWKSAPEEQPENAALLEISEIKQGETPRRIFLGWMFSSSPGLSSLEHPFYDVTVVKCEKAEAAPAPEPAPAPPKKTKSKNHH